MSDEAKEANACRTHIVSYPGGGAWAFGTLDHRFGEFEMVKFDTRNLEETLAEKSETLGEKNVAFIRRLATVPRIGSYLMLHSTGFTVSMRKYREASRQDLSAFALAVHAAFCDIFGFSRMQNA